MKRPLGLSGTDLAYVCLLVLVAALLAVLALFGQESAALILPFVIGAALGYVLARTVASPRSPRWMQSAFVISAALALASGAFLLVSPFEFIVPGQTLIDPSLHNLSTVLGRLACGVGFVYFGEILRSLAFPWLYPGTPEEADRRDRERARGGLIVGGLLLALVVVSALIFGALALISYLAAKFMG